MTNRIRQLLREIRAILGAHVRKLPLVVGLMLAAAGLDLLGVSLVAPFLGLALEVPGKGGNPSALLRGVDVRWLGMALVAVFALKGWLAFRVQRQITLTTESVRAHLMNQLLDAYQRQTWEFHLRRNSTELVNTVLWHTQSFTAAVLGSLLQMLANGFVFVALATLLLWTSPIAFATLAVLLGAVFLFATQVVRPRLTRSVQATAQAQADTIESVTQALGAWREVRVLGREKAFLARMSDASARLAENTAHQASLQLVPRQAIEFAVVAFLVGMVWYAQSGSGAHALVPMLGTFAAAALRLLPASTSILTSFNLFRASRFTAAVLARELEVLEHATPEATDGARSGEPGVFGVLELDRVSYRYENAPTPALANASLRVAAGEAIGVMGRSGAGKSTLADVMLGLLTPHEGRVLVNGVDVANDPDRWRRMVAYIPQNVYLLDVSLRQNIALGVPDAEVDEARLTRAVREAQLEELVAALPDGLATRVGERGVRLSGGQRQRVAIARALYHDRQFLVFDEATSALDPETERSIVEAIRALAHSKTVVVIAHRESTLRACDRIVRVEGGVLIESEAT